MVFRKSYRKAPAIMAGAFSFLLISSATLMAGELALKLFAEGRFNEARMESLRNTAENPKDYAAHLVALKSGVRLKQDHTEALKTFANDPGIDKELRCEAHFELAEVYHTRDQAEPALHHLVSCFNKTASPQLFAAATRKANGILNSNPELERANPQLVSIIRTSASTWKRGQSASEATSRKILSYPALWAIALYQSQISPAIGSRCSLTPSCSQYALHALKTHGLVGLGLSGDRMVREPDVVAAKKNPVVKGRQVKYSDPLCDHTFWMKGESK